MGRLAARRPPQFIEFGYLLERQPGGIATSGTGGGASLPRLAKPCRQLAAGWLTGTAAGGKEITARAGLTRVHVLDFLQQGPRIRSTTPPITSSSAGAKRCGSDGGSAPVFFSMSFIMSISILVARKLAPADSLTN
jgi:hypothetical protein